MQIDYSEFEKVEIRVGEIKSVEKFPEGKYSSHILSIDFGDELGIKKSLARLTPNYDNMEGELIGKKVLAVVNFAPKQIGKHKSEVLTLGVPDSDENVVLITPDQNVPLGGKLY
ncbi:MAG TPA: tRNA-binding protein [Candidatus Dojkabacteria bacterium]|jgi:tRNA-binding protein